MASLLNSLKEKLGHLDDYIVENWLNEWSPAQIPDIRDKTVVITGGHSGMGYQTARKLAENGARVIIVSRDIKQGVEKAHLIKSQVGKTARVDAVECDMSKLRNVVKLASEIKSMTDKLDVLVLNAGVFHPGPYAQTEDGIEQTLAVNYYSHALLTLALLDLLRHTPGSRAIFHSSPAEAYGKLQWDNLTGDKYRDSGMIPYSTSKLYGMMFFHELSRRVPEVDFICVHPGIVETPLQHKTSWRYWTAIVISLEAKVIGQSEYRGARTLMYAASAPELKGIRWGYFGPNNLQLYHATPRDAANRAVYNPVSCWKLFEETVKILDSKVGRDAHVPVPKHPDDVYGTATDIGRGKGADSYPAGATTIEHRTPAVSHTA